MQCIQNYHEVISNKYPHDAPNPEYNFIVNNISSFGKDSNNSNEDSPLQKSPKKIQKQNRVVNFIINTNSIFDNIQCQNMEIYSDFNKNIENKEEKIENNLNENIEQINTLKENNEISDSNNSNEYKTGRWSKEEHEKFIEGILKYGNEWRKVQKIIKSRSSTQARSHAQKFFLKLKKEINPDILSDSDKLLDLIISSCDKPRNSLKLSQEQKEKLMSVIRSNLKAEENCNKSGKEGLSFFSSSLLDSIISPFCIFSILLCSSLLLIFLLFSFLFMFASEFILSSFSFSFSFFSSIEIILLLSSFFSV